jgi:hypothetical protein
VIRLASGVTGSTITENRDAAAKAKVVTMRSA